MTGLDGKYCLPHELTSMAELCDPAWENSQEIHEVSWRNVILFVRYCGVKWGFELHAVNPTDRNWKPSDLVQFLEMEHFRPPKR